ncbi:chorismate mutase [Merismopedia glauca]|uniref:chorismate mutase n=1 Tax=Merismopedia glauca CCAP 1448/3 TaxID=1296344 RepID=A0A2T1C4A3_9CYAN|nr:chorismate mutase [Merismopedia glauca]PSB03086.1 chorismate mutase [Merismopedia glauca CCAP 1448/3]
MDWKVRAIRGATTASANTYKAIQEAVTELLTELQQRNQIDPDDIISATFTATQDLDAVFPAAIARQCFGWEQVPLLDVQHMHVEGAMPLCIRLLIHINLPLDCAPVKHIYLREAASLREDLNYSEISGSCA